MKKAVIDTNVLISALLKVGSVPDQVMDEVRNGSLIPVVDPYLRREYEEVLYRKKFAFDPERVKKLLEEIDRSSCECRSVLKGEQLNDPKDQAIFELFLTAEETYGACLITGNLKHYPEREGILSPREYLDNKDERQ